MRAFCQRRRDRGSRIRKPIFKPPQMRYRKPTV
jgi:hypothetical protein